MRLIIICLLIFINGANASDLLTSSQKISQEGMQLQSQRLKTIAQNIANANTTGQNPGDKPYQRKILVITNSYDDIYRSNLVKIDKIQKDAAPFNMRYEPSHPAADKNGYVLYPNLDINLEMIDAKEAQRSFEANLSALEIAKANKQKLLEALK